ncbi:alpha-mannosidase [Chloroflexota bacterium]
MLTIYLVPHTHYDAVWIFTREEYLKINEKIIEEALKLMKNSDFKFSLEQTYLLEQIENWNPDLWRKIADMIQAGNIEIVDGQYLMPDTMLANGEVLIRDIFWGKRYCMEKFGINVPVAWASDSFGLNAQLPQIYAKAGYKWLAFRRGARPDIRQSEFMWRGLDGTTILTHWFPLGYRAGFNLDGWYGTFLELNKFAATQHILMPCGSGSSLPQPEIPEMVKVWNDANTGVLMKMATPREFFQGLETARKTFETIEGEIYDDEVAEVFPGVCSTRSWIIQRSRECTHLLIITEAYATLAWLLGATYPTDELRDVWMKTLFTSFHDVMTGTSVDEVYGEVREIFDSLKLNLNNILNMALAYIGKKVNTDGKTTLVFNPLPYPVINYVQPASGEGFVAEVPPLGYASYKAIPQANEKSSIKVEGNRIETPFWLLDISKDTGIIKAYDKNGSLLFTGNELNIEDEVGDLYFHRTRFKPELIKSESGDGILFSRFKTKAFSIQSEGSRVRAILESEYYCLTWPYRLTEKFPPIIYKYKKMDIRKEVIVYRDIPRIEFVTKINNQLPNIRLRVKFDTGMERRVYFRETQFGVIAEPTEYVTKKGTITTAIPNFLNWFDINDGVRGITFMNRGLADMEVVETAVYITLFRSVTGVAADGLTGPLVPTPDALEIGNHTFEYAIQPHEGDWRQAGMYKQAREYIYPLVSITADSKGDLPAESSFLQLSPDNLILSALKKAEDSDEVILRFYETKGEKTPAEVKLFREIKRLTRVDLLEREEDELPVDGNSFNLEVKPFEIVSLKIKF